MGAEYWGREILDSDDHLRVMVAKEVVRAAEDAAERRQEGFLIQMLGEKG